MQQSLTPSFDTWTSIFLLVSSLGFFLGFVLSLHKNSRKINIPIVLIITGFSFILLQYVFYWTKYNTIYPYLYFFDSSWYLAFGPLLYTYVSKFYNITFKTKWYHFAPATICFIINCYFFIITNGFQDLATYKADTLYYFLWNIRSPWLAALSLIIYLLFTKDFILVNSSKTSSQYEILRKKWINLICNLFLLFSLAYISYYVLVQFSFFNSHWDYAISFSMSFSIYAIGYMVYKEPSIFNGELLSNIFIKPETNGSLTENTKKEFFQQLVSHIQTKKPYLKNDLRLVQLADELGFSSHLLSKLINEKANKNFNQFINEYRLEEARKLLLNEESTSIKTIYYDVGFNNKATFNNAFKNKFNCTPSEFKKKAG